MKICNNPECAEINPQPYSHFYKDKNNKTDGHYSICKACKTKKVLHWRSENKDHYNAYMRSKSKTYYPKGRLKRYDLTPEEHEGMLESQNHVCKLCKKPPNGRRPLVVDHNRLTGEVRGLLCYGCNRLIVILDSHPLHEDALVYVKGKAA